MLELYNVQSKTAAPDNKKSVNIANNLWLQVGQLNEAKAESIPLIKVPHYKDLKNSETNDLWIKNSKKSDLDKTIQSEPESNDLNEEEFSLPENIKSRNIEEIDTALAPIFNQYLNDYQLAFQSASKNREQGLEIDGLALTVGKAYEKIRKVIDWKEENALRRGAIYRALKRHMLGQIYGLADAKQFNVEENAEEMVLELMRTGYFNNELIASPEIKAVEKILSKHLLILTDKKVRPDSNGKKAKRRDMKQQIKFQTWLLEIAACEIEECLAPALKEKATIKLMLEVMKKRIKIEPAKQLSPFEEEIQIELAVRRALYNADNSSLVYQILKMRYPFWFYFSDENTKKIENEIVQIYDQTQADLNDKNSAVFSNITEKYDAAYRLIEDMMNEVNEEVDLKTRTKLFADKKWVEQNIEIVYERRRKSLKSRLFRSAIWYTLSILAANAASVIILEGPLARLLGYDFTWLSVAADLLLPTFIMFILVWIIKPPAASNFLVVANEIKKIIYPAVEEDIYLVKLKKKKRPVWLRVFFTTTYLLCAGLALWFIYWALSVFKLPPTSVYLNVVYVTMVFFAGLAVKKKSQEITIEEKGNALEFIWDLFSVPLARIGSWFSNKWKEYNVVAILFSAVVDTPFSALVTMIGDWRTFLKERAAELK